MSTSSRVHRAGSRRRARKPEGIRLFLDRVPPVAGARRIRMVAKAGYEDVTIGAGAQTTYWLGFA
jgi:hypothetical protein